MLAETTKQTIRESIILQIHFEPEEIISTKWTKWNEPDEIEYKAADGSIHQVIDENILRDIIEYMTMNKLKGKFPYLHIEGKFDMECFEQPTDKIIIQFLKDNLSFYHIFDLEGNLE